MISSRGGGGTKNRRATLRKITIYMALIRQGKQLTPFHFLSVARKLNSWLRSRLKKNVPKPSGVWHVCVCVCVRACVWRLPACHPGITLASGHLAPKGVCVTLPLDYLRQSLLLIYQAVKMLRRYAPDMLFLSYIHTEIKQGCNSV